jgi:heme-binding protein
MRRILKWTLIVGGLVFIVIQFFGPARTNPPVDPSQTMEATIAVPSDVSAVFARSCGDCHSNKTNWRWYTYVAPVSWFTVGHVDEGRGELNFSTWGTYSARKKDTRLKAICAQCRSGEMPLPSYALVHREVKLSPQEVEMICAWTEATRKELGATAGH